MSSISHPKQTVWTKIRAKITLPALSRLSMVWGIAYVIWFLGSLLGEFLLFKFGPHGFEAFVEPIKLLWAILILVIMFSSPIIIVEFLNNLRQRRWKNLFLILITVAITYPIVRYTELLIPWFVNNPNALQVILTVFLIAVPMFLFLLFIILFDAKQQNLGAMEDKRLFLKHHDILEFKTIKRVAGYWSLTMLLVLVVSTGVYLLTPWLISSSDILKSVLLTLFSLFMGALIALFYEIVKSWIYHPKVVDFDRRLRELQTQNQEAEKFRYLAAMATAAAHQLNQPIGIIRAATDGALDDIKEGYFQPDDIQPLLERTLTQSDRLATIIDSFRRFARGDRTHREPVNLNTVVSETINNLLEQFKQHNIELHLELASAHREPLVWANPYQLAEVLFNLLINAKEAVETQTDAQIWATTWHDNKGHIGFLIEDNGPGVDADYQQKMFVPFNSTKSTEKGTGLGLYISQRIINEFGGDIQYQDRAEGGACFMVTLPVFDNTIEGENVDGRSV